MNVDFVAWTIVGVTVAATVWLAYYTRVFLPRRLEERLKDSITAFSTAVELRFPTHVGLTTRVQALSAAVGKELGMDRRQVAALEMAARLRDVGLCAIPYRLVNGRSVPHWNEAEQRTYDQHPKVSGAMLEMVPSMRHLAHIVRNHHAWFDGNGPGDEVAGKDLPVESLILKVVSEYVWIDRWQGAVIARDELNKGRGTAFAPHVVEALWNVLPSTRVADSRQTATAS